MAHALLRRFGSLDGVFRAPVEELMQVEGIGENAALLIRLVPQLYQRSLIELDRPGSLSKITSRRGIFSSNISGRAHRDCAGAVRGRKRPDAGLPPAQPGRPSAAAFNVRDAVRYALADNAVSVYLAHNHPSGYAVPSEQDYAATWTVRESLRTVGVELLDHFVVADNDFVSIASGGTWMRRSICGSEENDGKNGRNQNQRHAYFGPKAHPFIRPTAIRTRKGRQ